MTPQRIQLRRTKGWILPPNTVKVDRTTRWGNPFRKDAEGVPRTPAVLLFEDMIGRYRALVTKVRGRPTVCTVADIKLFLRGKNLACWCSLPVPCHADVLLRIANEG